MRWSWCWVANPPPTKATLPLPPRSHLILASGTLFGSIRNVIYYLIPSAVNDRARPGPPQFVLPCPLRHPLRLTYSRMPRVALRLRYLPAYLPASLAWDLSAYKAADWLERPPRLELVPIAYGNWRPRRSMIFKPPRSRPNIAAHDNHWRP